MTDILKTFKGEDIKLSTRGILYLCHYNYDDNTIKVMEEIQFDDSFNALNAYANIHNPESQLATGNTFDELIDKLSILHNNLNNPTWVKRLADYM